MGQFVKGDVVVIPFPFTDLSGSKKRPALVVAPLSGDDIILCMITGQKRTDNYAIPLDSSDFVSGGIKYDSTIRPNRLFTADGNRIIRHAGHISKKKAQEVIEKIIDIIK